MKLFSDMCEDSILMVFKEMWDWDIEVKTAKRTKTFSFQAVLHMPGHRDSFVPREYWPQQQAKSEKDMPGYRNFPWGKYQVFCADAWVGETDDMDTARAMAKSYITKMYEAEGLRTRETDQ